jgi:hypothetical protein
LEHQILGALELICEAKAALPVDQMESRHHVRRLRDVLSEKVGAANQRLKALKARKPKRLNFNPAVQNQGPPFLDIEEVETYIQSAAFRLGNTVLCLRH